MTIVKEHFQAGEDVFVIGALKRPDNAKWEPVVITGVVIAPPDGEMVVPSSSHDSVHLRIPVLTEEGAIVTEQYYRASSEMVFRRYSEAVARWKPSRPNNPRSPYFARDTANAH